MLTVTPPANVNQIFPSCVPWPGHLCAAQENVSPSTVQESTTAKSLTVSTNTTTSTVRPGESSTVYFTITTTTASITTTTGVFATSNPQKPDQQSSTANFSFSSEGIIYSLIASVVVLALFIVVLAIFLTMRFHRRCQDSKTSLQGDPRPRSENYSLVLSVYI